MTLPRLHLIATGGTIAGLSHVNTAPASWSYTAAQLGAEQLLQATPELLNVAQWTVEQPYSIGSQDLTPQHLVVLQQSVLAALQSPTVDAVIVTHGTDTVEDALYFLHLTIPVVWRSKAILFVAAMLPSDHPNADGPDNLRQAVHLALTGELGASPMGLVMNGCFLPADQVMKWSTAGVAAFEQPLGGAFSDMMDLDGPSAGACADFHAPLFEQVEVPVVYCTPGLAPLRSLESALKRGVQSVVIAAPGHGNIPEMLVPILRTCLLAGIDVIRASRVPYGGVEQGGEFDSLDAFRSPQPGCGVFREGGSLSLNKLAMLEMLKHAMPA
ncbi:asparaginase domain-containing protein [Limnobacter humi]|uniref:Asparaginase domain-containing protein n=1 Tax=Limnobacter humi TaxID=1778671 RepID=A0ABT1WEG5_9BURK|nr:asparaginase domain-containing protein [Limnobacter humi]MCQ8895894.1 asparaginase domain-containing protein [Limnobacter humi]